MKRKLLQYTILAALAFTTVFGFWSINQVYAQHLITTSDILKHVNKMVQEGQVLHFFKTVYIRRDSSITEPPDPYHMPLLPILNSKQIVETWVSPQIIQSVTRLEGNSQDIISEFIKRSDSYLSYDAIEGNAFEFSLDESTKSATAKENKTIDDVSWISGMRTSAWGRIAWVVSFQPEAASPEQFSPPSIVSPSGTTPYAANITFDQTQWVQEVDQTSGLLVSRQWLALTKPESTVLYAESYSQPEVISAATLTHELGVFITTAAKDMLTDIEATTKVDATEAEKLMSGTSTSLSEIATGLTFPLYKPDEAVVGGFPAKSHQLRTYFAPQHQCHLQRPLSYDFDLCAGLGRTVRFEYTFWSSEDHSDLKSINVLQADANEIVPLLKQSPPRWQSSTSFDLFIDNQQVQAWNIPVLHGDTNINALLFELNGTFIQLSGYKMPPDDLVTFAQSFSLLQEEPVGTSSYRVFVPLVSHK